MLDLAAKIADSAAAIRRRWDKTPQVGIILGTGLGNFARSVQTEAHIAYESIPHFPRSTVDGHKGQLLCGTLRGVPVLTMEGRFHAYEGYPLKLVTLPVRVMNALGVELLIVSCASGGLNPRFKAGDVLVIDDHINLMGDNPLLGINDETLGPRFPDMIQPYDLKLVERALEIARQQNFVAHRGVYVAVRGPNFETGAEYRFLRLIGGDVVGMSTVPEVIVAVHCGLRVLGLSTVTNVASPDVPQQTSHDEVLAIARGAEPKIHRIISSVIQDVAGCCAC
jgi:purine-nucleoside phosphorylase